ncbi:MAG: GDSL-type esterase/lipase family protein, partial [Mucilaginibacter sp.]
MIGNKITCVMKRCLLQLLNISFLLIFSFQGFCQKRVIKVIYIGDSITYGGWLNDIGTEAPPVLASSYLKHQRGIDSVEFSNQGHSGYTTVNFLPGGNAFIAAEKAVGSFSDKDGSLVFSIMLGTNDSAVKGPRGAPVAPEDFKINMKSIVDQLLSDFPKSKIVINLPLWYSPNTYNGAQYLQEGLDRLQSYSEPIKMLIKEYHNDRVFLG